MRRGQRSPAPASSDDLTIEIQSLVGHWPCVMVANGASSSHSGYCVQSLGRLEQLRDGARKLVGIARRDGNRSKSAALVQLQAVNKVERLEAAFVP